MKKVLLVAVLVLSFGTAYAQEVIDTFDVGPYKVFYSGKDDYEYDLKNKNEDLYEFFGLERYTIKDTIRDTIRDVVEEKQKVEPRKLGFLLDLFCEGGTYRSTRFSIACGLDGTMKHRIANKTYLSYGLSFGYAAVTTDVLKEDLFEIGIPLSIEWSDLNEKNATLYGGVGIVPTYYLTANAKYISDFQEDSPKTYSGIFLAPRLDFGVYIPLGKPIIKLGLTWRYKFNCSTKKYDVYRNVVGRSFLGVNLGVIF